jgi:hypothetical protein
MGIDAYDRLGTRLEQRFMRSETAQMMSAPAIGTSASRSRRRSRAIGFSA